VQNLVLIQATSPLLTAADLARGIEKFDSGDYDSLLSVVRQKRFVWEERDGDAAPMNYEVAARPRRQDFDGMLVENGAFYITSRASLLATGCRLSGRIGLVEMAEETYAELDEPADWPVIESLLRARSNLPDRQSPPLPDLARIRALFSDCDGVLTDGGMYYTEFGDEMKRFQTRDGVGFQMLRERNVLTGIITSEAVDLVRRRGEKLWLDEVHLGVSDKLALVRSLCEQHGLALDEVAYVGDDVGDLDVIKAVGLGCAVRTAIPQVVQAARYVTATRGGEGAVREIAELICAAIDREGRPYPS
jgi:N-acylneuraminate cytidylyltransferase